MAIIMNSAKAGGAEANTYGVALNHTSGTKSNYTYGCKGYSNAHITVSGSAYTYFKYNNTAFPSADFNADVSNVDTLTIEETVSNINRNIQLNVALS